MRRTLPSTDEFYSKLADTDLHPRIRTGGHYDSYCPLCQSKPDFLLSRRKLDFCEGIKLPLLVHCWGGCDPMQIIWSLFPNGGTSINTIGDVEIMSSEQEEKWELSRQWREREKIGWETEPDIYAACFLPFTCVMKALYEPRYEIWELRPRTDDKLIASIEDLDEFREACKKAVLQHKQRLGDKVTA